MQNPRSCMTKLIEKTPFVYGAPDDVIGKLEKYVKAGCRHFVMNFQVSPAALKETCQLLADRLYHTLKKRVLEQTRRTRLG